MQKRSIWVAAAAVAFAAAPASAQMAGLPISAEVRGGAAFPTGDFGEEDVVDTGWKFGGNVKLQFTPMLAAYVGYSRAEFGADGEGSEDVDAKVIDSGIDAGIQANIPGLALSLSPWVRGGIVYHKAELSASGDGGSISFDSDNSLGFEVGGGIAYALGQRLSITPGVSYVSYTPKFEFAGETAEEKLSYFTVDIGLSMRF